MATPPGSSDRRGAMHASIRKSDLEAVIAQLKEAPRGSEPYNEALAELTRRLKRERRQAVATNIALIVMAACSLIWLVLTVWLAFFQ
jgi:uncharacterized tellurite resistance protein B-like protein